MEVTNARLGEEGAGYHNAEAWQIMQTLTPLFVRRERVLNSERKTMTRFFLRKMEFKGKGKKGSGLENRKS